VRGGKIPVDRVIEFHQCAQCGADLIEPEWSEHFPDRRTRNLWSCEACGYQFEDTVYWSAPELADAE
jgi:ribosomal protein L37AE/L43A